MAKQTGPRRPSGTGAGDEPANGGHAPEAPLDERVVAAALDLAAAHGWRDVSLADIAAAANAPMAALYDRFPSKAAILDAMQRQTDVALASGPAPDPSERARDRVFDVVMRRLEILAPRRAGLRAVWRDLGRDPLAVLASGPALARSLAWMLETAGLDTAGLAGMARVKALGAVYLATLPVWLDDDGPDLARTMARLDRGLRRVDRVSGLFGGDAPPADAREAPPDSPETPSGHAAGA